MTRRKRRNETVTIKVKVILESLNSKTAPTDIAEIYKEAFLKPYQMVTDAKKSIKMWMYFSNAERTHWAFDRSTYDEEYFAGRILAT